MQSSPYQAPIIVIDGPDGTGKTSVIKMLLQEMAGQKMPDFATMSFPRYVTPTGRYIRELLNGMHGDFLAMNPYEASKPYADDRVAALPAITAIASIGMPQVFNRYVSSNQCHQGAKILDPAAQRRFIKWVEHYEYEELGLPRPTMSVFLHLPAEISQRRAIERDRETGAAADMAQNNLEHLRAAERAYQVLAGLLPPDQVRVVECLADDGRELTIPEVYAKVRVILAPLLGLPA